MKKTMEQYLADENFIEFCRKEHKIHLEVGVFGVDDDFEADLKRNFERYKELYKPDEELLEYIKNGNVKEQLNTINKL